MTEQGRSTDTIVDDRLAAPLSPRIADAIVPFDYVVDGDGRYFIVRAEASWAGRPHLVGKLLYSQGADGRLQKCRGWLTAAPPHTPSPYGGATDFLLDPEGARHVSYRDLPIDRVPNLPEEVRAVSRLLEEGDAFVYLTGSRLLGIAKTHSDWDLAVVGGTGALQFRSVLGRLPPSLRLFRPEECDQRAIYYARHSASVNADDLSRLFNAALPYLRTPNSEVGVFFTDGCLHRLPPVESLRASAEVDVEGEILASDGRSYLLPRTCQIERASDDVVALSTLSWELAGLEALRGTWVKATNVYETAVGYWFKDSHSRLRLCPVT